jgi:Flp pilus assembly pilin Flp
MSAYPDARRVQAFAPQGLRVGTMDRLVTLIGRLARTDDGQDLLEYAMLCALIALVAVGAVTQVGNTINTVLWEVIAAANV